MATYYKIKSGSSGGFLDPPGSPQHSYEVAEMAGNHRQIGWLSVEAAATEEWVPEATRAACQRLLDTAKVVPSEAWLAQVYSYFANCYSPDGINRNAGDCIIDPEGEIDPERSLAVLHIRQWFPDHEIRADLLNQRDGYGQKVCRACGATVQYEAAIDGYAIPCGRSKFCAGTATVHVVK